RKPARRAISAGVGQPAEWLSPVAIDGRKAHISSAVMRSSLLFAYSDFATGGARLETCCHGRSDLRGRIDNDNTGFFQRLTLRQITSSIARDDRTCVAPFLAPGCRGAGAQAHRRFGNSLGITGSALLHPTADFSDDDNGIGANILVERFERITGGRADHWIATDADEG